MKYCYSRTVLISHVHKVSPTLTIVLTYVSINHHSFYPVGTNIGCFF